MNHSLFAAATIAVLLFASCSNDTRISGSVRDLPSSEIVVARLGDEVTVKRLQKTPQGIELHPENPDYPVIHVRQEESFAIEGLAVGLIRNSLQL